ncbi:MAG: acyl-CoA dehydrogenase family protein [Candidatus Dormibacteraeota bacterium]|uniref:Acyl-CoA dehydrogenase family protein n=1 Tax=Candidatus Amunia macphersoniae TaxID=3127014 RepID=A0A934N900_9BACT|nr:acyl-CoA dehydrogenase family protein [Candidatus Dormibacteraeota bacterium]
MDFAFDSRTEELRAQLLDFMTSHVYPAERVVEEQHAALSNQWDRPPVMDELKAEARRRGLWNLFLPNHAFGAGLTNLQYAPLAEITGWSPMIAPEAINCAAPDTGNMEILAMFGTPDQQQRWLRPLLDGEIRSAFSMTEPEVASSDATNISTRIERDGGEYVVTGRKWWSSGAMSPRCALAIVMGVTDADAQPHRRQSMVLVPLDSPGVNVRRATTVFGYSDGAHGGHADIEYDEVRVPAANLLGEEGSGFAIAQARLGPGRIHHCMRVIGMADRALDLMCRRVSTRTAFGRVLAEQGVVQEWIAEAFIRLEQARLLVLKAAWMMDRVGNREARREIAAIKVAAPQAALWVLERAIQAHGGAGVSQDFPLAQFYAHARTLQLADGPDEVHRRAIARDMLRPFAAPPENTTSSSTQART